MNKSKLIGALTMKAFGMLLCFWVSLLLCAGCGQKTREAQYVRHFNLDKSARMNLSDFVDSISLIPLATSDSSLIKNVNRLSVVHNRFYINDNMVKLLVFNRDGNLVSSSEQVHGYGPEEYTGCIDFDVLPNGNIEIYDVLRYKIREYDSVWAVKKVRDLPEALLPVSNVSKVAGELCVFEDDASLKFYSLEREEIVKTVTIPIVKGMSTITRNAGLQEMAGNIYYSSRKPENVLYRINIETLDLEPCYLFDFGEKNFEMSDLPIDQDISFYQNYVMDRTDKAFVADKLVTDNWQLCFVIYNRKMCVALYDERTGRPMVYYNQAREKGQLMIPHLCQDNMLYYVCEPQHLEYVVDKDLMSSEDREKMDKVSEDDNPVIVCYKLK